ncbi:MAG: hypothetical protein H6528_00885 [Actinobacteria bacterium]|mgnify:CR=1 FL=1|nr:hypothetical protein [Actinomycetota bacterium]MCB8995841.1 hypothetical protein [Actinomycetota bacterium]HRY08448.1 hypothetical protein [Candidatus Nanopelagicales bacterium]
MSSRLVSEGVFDAESRRVATAQVAAGLAIVIVVTIPMLLFDAPTSLHVAETLLLLVVLGVGYLTARAAQASVLRSVLYLVAVLLVVAGVLVIKALVGH